MIISEGNEVKAFATSKEDVSVPISNNVPAPNSAVAVLFFGVKNHANINKNRHDDKNNVHCYTSFLIDFLYIILKEG